MTATDFLGYDELDAALVRMRIGTDASELHGSLCGYLAGGGALDKRPLLAALELEGDEAVVPAPQDQALLERLADQSRGELADPELGFEPLLPADDRPLAERTEALVEWCRGFLGGFGLAGAGAHAQLSEEAQEILRDLTIIAGSAFDFGDEAEDEDALIEVHEFVRMGAMLLFTECQAAQRPANDTLH
ncbi:UPF0149 family protein [Frateuria hangzhouensis]|uniref:UPF0149 family protein n=1 Tax=Frateuria hangzhouensis TaxID=2995589 RepID=UPI002260A885|nr:UPF0149 family protein [Frateuria sp. STR12]MCX7512854.1 UPF0149 family protein [Frateuria sp. STR12]